MSVEDLKAAWQAAEDAAIAWGAEKDAALQAVHEQYDAQHRDLNNTAAEAQKAYLDAEATSALADREDGYSVAVSLGLVETADELGMELTGDDRG